MALLNSNNDLALIERLINGDTDGGVREVAAHYTYARQDNVLRALLAGLIDAQNGCIEIVDEQGLVCFVAHQGRMQLGYVDSETALGRPWAYRWPKGQRAQLQKLLEQALEGTRRQHIAWRQNCRGGCCDWQLCFVPLHVSGRRFVLIVSRDVSEQQRLNAALERSEARLHELIDKVPKVFWVYDLQKGRYEYISPSFERILGVGLDTLSDDARAWMRHIHPEDVSQVQKVADSCHEWMQDPAPVDLQYRLLNPDGNVVWVHDLRYPVVEAGRLVRMVGVLSDITEERERQQRLHYLANHDQLTGLANRTHCQEWLGRACRKRQAFQLLLVGLDRFKQINDSLGPHQGDELLKQVAGRIHVALNSAALLARLGGDEFAVVLEGERSQEDQRVVAHGISVALSQRFTLGRNAVFITASIGISSYPQDGENTDILMQNADVALSNAKYQGRNTIRFFKSGDDETTLSRFSLESALNRAWENEEFQLHYQPKVDACTFELVGFEALLRWRGPDNTPMSPAQFIPVLEDTGLIVPVGYWILERVCQDLQRMKAKGLVSQIAVNIAARQLMESDFADQLQRIMRHHHVSPGEISLEITESSLMQEPARAAELLTRLRAAGASVALDDFGTGYSSLSYLKRFPVDTLKIDRSFIMDMVDDDDDRNIVDAIIRMAHALNLIVVAEGVESTEQHLLLQQYGCDQLQGYLFAKPMPFEEIIAWHTIHIDTKWKIGAGSNGYS
ncbi:putative bifunctional diguanylate cyclase/phosphodiesterase [Halomonas sp. WWR20]